MKSAYEHHVVKADGVYQLRVFKHGHLVKEGKYKSYADAMNALVRFNKKEDKDDTR